MQNHWLFSSNDIYFCKCQKAEEDKRTSEELNSAHRRSQAKFHLVQTSYIKRIKLFLFLPYNKHLIDRAKSVFMGESWSRSLWENLDLGRVYRFHCVRSVLTTSVKMLPYRPPAQLIRAKYYSWSVFILRDTVQDKMYCLWTCNRKQEQPNCPSIGGKGVRE